MGLSASSVADLSMEELKSAKFRLLFGPVDKVLEERLLNVLKDNRSSIYHNLEADIINFLELLPQQFSRSASYYPCSAPVVVFMRNSWPFFLDERASIGRRNRRWKPSF